MDWIKNNIVAALALCGAFIISIYKIGSTIGSYRGSFNNLMKEIIPAIKDRLEKLENSNNSMLEQKIKKRKSPLSLTPYAEKMLEDINFQDIFEKIKETLCEQLDDLHLKTRYDIQEMSEYIMRKIQNTDLSISFKKAAFENGYPLQEILSAGSIPLRDYYLSIHPEIVD